MSLLQLQLILTKVLIVLATWLFRSDWSPGPPQPEVLVF